MGMKTLISNMFKDVKNKFVFDPNKDEWEQNGFKKLKCKKCRDMFWFDAEYKIDYCESCLYKYDDLVDKDNFKFVKKE